MSRLPIYSVEEAKEQLLSDSVWGIVPAHNCGVVITGIQFVEQLSTDNLHVFNVTYKSSAGGKHSVQTLGVDRETGQIINCTVDDD